MQTFMYRERERERERGATPKRRDVPEGTRTHAHFYDWYSANPPVCMFHARVALTDVFLVARLRVRLPNRHGWNRGWVSTDFFLRDNRASRFFDEIRITVHARRSS